MLLFARRDEADDVLIVSPEGRLKDTSVANIALKIDGAWWTPSEPLLPGTMREKLLYEGRVKERDLKITDLKQADSLALMNAMIGFRELEDPAFSGN